MKTFNNFINALGWVYLLLLLFITIDWALPHRLRKEYKNSRGTVCSWNKGWFEKYDVKKKTCHMYWIEEYNPYYDCPSGICNLETK